MTGDVPEDTSTMWLVILGKLNDFNDVSECYQPTRRAAILFAQNNLWNRGAKILNPDLEVIRRYDGEGHRIDKHGKRIRPQ